MYYYKFNSNNDTYFIKNVKGKKKSIINFKITKINLYINKVFEF